ncbi:MAG TPA: serine/threonine-protein kinase, partial [Planctomycetaceae bacterium]
LPMDTQVADTLLGSLIDGRYRIRGRVARGGMATVYTATDERLERTVAVKIIHPTQASEAQTRLAGFVARFTEEAKTIARLTHPNVVAVYDAGETRGLHFLAMQYVDGGDFHDLVKSDGPLPLGLAADLIAQAAAGLDYAHRRGAIHRDVKPPNLMLDRSGVVKVLDLGLARLTDDRPEDGGLTRAGVALGTADYIAPEQACVSAPAGPAADVYGLGGVLHFLLTGRPFYPGLSPVETLMAHRDGAIPSLRAARQDVPPTVDRLLGAMAAKRPEDRPSMAEVEAILRPFRKPADVSTGARGGGGPRRGGRVAATGGGSTTDGRSGVTQPEVADVTADGTLDDLRDGAGGSPSDSFADTLRPTVRRRAGRGGRINPAAAVSAACLAAAAVWLLLVWLAG